MKIFAAGAVAAAFAAAPVAAAPPAPPAAAVEKAIHKRLESFKGEMGVYARNLDTGEAVAVNADERFPTASVIKVAVMVEVFQQIALGRITKDQLLTLDEGIKVEGSGVLFALRPGGTYSVGDLLYLMIAVSDNTATNMLVDLVGTKNVDERMEKSGFPLVRLYRGTYRQGKPDVFPEEEKEYGLGSGTPRQLAGLLETIARGTAVSASASEEMMALLRRQQDVTMIPRRLPEREDVVVGSKSGTTSEPRPDARGFKGSVRNDVAVVKTRHGTYVIAIFTRHGLDTRDGIENAGLLAGADVSRLVFDHWDRGPGR